MANTLFDHGAKYHFHDVKITQNHATMKETEHDKTKPSKLELLQDDYRSRLLHEREQKANALFEQKVRAELLPKKASVREFFLNRRMLAASTTGASNGVNLPPIKRNTRYEDKQKDKTKRVGERKEKERVEATAFLEDMKTQDCSLSELGKLREKHRKSKTTENQQDVPAIIMAENSLNPSFSSAYDKIEVNRDDRNASLPKARGVKSREVYKRGTKPSHETNKEGNSSRDSQELESSFIENKMTKARRGVKSREVYKRERKPSEEGNTETNTHANTKPNANSEHLASSFTENVVSKSLVKIKELVNRRKTEELILRSKTAKLTAQSQTPSPRRNSQSFEEMCKVEIELRETISREQKKLLALQERRRQKVAEYRNEIESRKEIGGKDGQPIQRKQTTLRQSREEKTTKIMKKSERESHQETYTEQTRSNSKKTKQNSQNEMMDKTNTNCTNSVSNERNAKQLQQIKKPQVTQSAELQLKQQKNSSSVDATIDLVTCSNCGRSFMKERIAKHEKACRKASARTKKPFDARRKRAECTDMEKYIIMGKGTDDDLAYKEKKRDWRRTHENFVQSIRSARCHEPQPARPLTNPDYIECSYCQRKFKPSVAETHIPRCKDIKARPRPPRR